MPIPFTAAITDRICERLVEGESLRAICRDPAMPACSTVFAWLARDPEFAARYARAREAQADALFEECLAIADDVSGDVKLSAGREVANAEFVSRSRLRIDTRKWMVAKLAPRKYGDAVALKHAGGDGGPVEMVIRWARTQEEATEDPAALAPTPGETKPEATRRKSARS